MSKPHQKQKAKDNILLKDQLIRYVDIITENLNSDAIAFLKNNKHEEFSLLCRTCFNAHIVVS